MNDNVIELTESNFEQEINGEIPILVDFWAEWCTPCRMLSSVMVELSEEYNGKMKVGKADVDKCLEQTKKYQLTAVPDSLEELET